MGFSWPLYNKVPSNNNKICANLRNFIEDLHVWEDLKNKKVEMKVNFRNSIDSLYLKGKKIYI